MIIATHLLLAVVGSAMILTAVPVQAGGRYAVDTYRRDGYFHRHDAYRSFRRYGRYWSDYRYRGHVGRCCLGFRYYQPRRHAEPPYTGVIRGKMAEFYRSRPQVLAHYGADAPVWSEDHLAHHNDAPQTMLHIVIASPTGQLSVDGRDLGHVAQWPKGRIQLAITPGSHTIKLRRGDSVYTRKVHAYEGLATVVKAGIR